MLEKLTRLRAAPKGVRDRYAFGVAASFTVVIALLWMVTLPSRFAQTPGDIEDGAGTKPFASLFATARDQFAAVVQGVNPDSVTTSTTNTSAVTDIAPMVTPRLDPNAITLTPEDIAAVEGRATDYVPAPTTTPRTVQIVTSSSVGGTTTTAGATSTQRQ